MASFDFDLPSRRVARKTYPCSQAKKLPSRRRQRVDCKLLRVERPDSEDIRTAEAALSALARLRSASSTSEPYFAPRPEGEAQEESPVKRGWQALLRRIETNHAWRVKQELGEKAVLDPVYPEVHVQKRFLDACKTLDHCLTVTYHGTRWANIDSIKQRGLLVPGHGGVKVVNGSAHGVGVYTAHIGSASLSRGFCNSDTMFVCAVCDTSLPLDPEMTEGRKPAPFKPSMTHVQTVFPNAFTFQGRSYGNHQLKQESQEVRHVGKAVVVMEERCVVPVFTAKVPTPESEGRERHVKDLDREEEPWEVGPQQIGRRRLVVPEEGKELIRFGSRTSGRSGKTVWIPALPKRDATAHERTVQRHRCRKKRQLGLCQARRVKREALQLD